jgi:chromosome partitioning protein
MEEQIRDAWGSMVLKNVVRETDEVGKGQIRMRTVFEQAIDQRSSTGRGEMPCLSGNLSVMKFLIA